MRKSSTSPNPGATKSSLSTHGDGVAPLAASGVVQPPEFTTLNAFAGTPVISFQGNQVHNATLQASASTPTIGLVGSQKHSGQLVVSSGTPTVSFDGRLANPGALSASAAPPVVELSSAANNVLSASAAAPAVGLSGNLANPGSLGASAGQPGVGLVGRQKHLGALSVTAGSPVVSMTGVHDGGGGGSYQYILDDYPWMTYGYSLRKLRSAYSGPCIRIRVDTTGQPEYDIGFVDNFVDVADIVAKAAGNDVYVVIWYNQALSGASYDCSQPTVGTQPLIAQAGVVITRNGLVCVRFDAARDDQLASGVNPPSGQNAVGNAQLSGWVASFDLTNGVATVITRRISRFSARGNASGNQIEVIGRNNPVLRLNVPVGTLQVPTGCVVMRQAIVAGPAREKFVTAMKGITTSALDSGAEGTQGGSLRLGLENATSNNVYVSEALYAANADATTVLQADAEALAVDIDAYWYP